MAGDEARCPGAATVGVLASDASHPPNRAPARGRTNDANDIVDRVDVLPATQWPTRTHSTNGADGALGAGGRLPSDSGLPAAVFARHDEATNVLYHLIAFNEARSSGIPRMVASIDDATLLSGITLPPTSLVGREAEIRAVASLLRDRDTRLVTLTGPGGVGKTRLAFAAASAVGAAFPDGIHVASLAAIADAALAPAAICAALGVREVGTAPGPNAIATVLAGRRILLVLDNLEHVVASAAPFVATLLAACPGLRILATSRVRLRLVGEHEVMVQPLAVSSADGSEPAAIRVFTDRAGAARPGFVLAADNAEVVAAICRRLDGLPLAIELAAAWIRVLSPSAVLARLDPALPLLAGGPRDAPARQRTVRDTVAWSYGLLDPAERRVFRWLSVFTGGCSLEAAEAVAADVVPDVLAGAATLVEYNLLRTEDGPAGEPRFAMLETVREYGLEQLSAADEADAARHSHLAWFLAVAERVHPHTRGPGAERWLDRLTPDHGNLRGAIAWALERGDGESALRLCVSLLDFWYLRGHILEGRRWLESSLSAGADAPAALRAPALHGLGEFAHDAGDSLRATTAIEAALPLYRALGDRHGTALALTMLGVMAEDRGDYATATQRLTAARSIFEALDDRHCLDQTIYHLAVVALGQGNLELALALCDESETFARAANDHFNLANPLWCAGLVRCRLGDPATAAEAFAEALAEEDALGDLDGAAPVFASVAVLAVAVGLPAAAARILGTADALCSRRGTMPALPEREDYDRAAAQARERLGATAFRAQWDVGRGRTVAGSMADVQDVFAAARAPAALPGPDDRFGLTGREREVLALLARRLSNKEIADALCIGPRTVQSHSISIFGKLGVANRREAAAAAVRLGLA